MGPGTRADPLELVLWCGRALGRWLGIWVTPASMCGIAPLSLSGVCRSIEWEGIACVGSAEGCGVGGENRAPSQRLIISTSSFRPEASQGRCATPAWLQCRDSSLAAPRFTRFSPLVTPQTSCSAWRFQIPRFSDPLSEVRFWQAHHAGVMAAARRSGVRAEALIRCLGRLHVARLEIVNQVARSLHLHPHCGRGSAGAPIADRRLLSQPRGARVERDGCPTAAGMLAGFPVGCPCTSLRVIPPVWVSGWSRRGAPPGCATPKGLPPALCPLPSARHPVTNQPG